MRVLVLEDDPFVALDLQAILEGEGHEVVGVFETLAEAGAHLHDGFDYALLDIELIDGKSYGIAAELQEQHIPFAFVTAAHPTEVPLSFRQASFIPKPYEERSILRSLEKRDFSVSRGGLGTSYVGEELGESRINGL